MLQKTLQKIYGAATISFGKICYKKHYRKSMGPQQSHLVRYVTKNIVENLWGRNNLIW